MASSEHAYSPQEDKEMATLRKQGKKWKDIAAKMGRSELSLRKHYVKYLNNQPAPANLNGSGHLPRQKGMSLAEFVEENDADTKTRTAIKREVKSLKDGRILKDAEFMQECGGRQSNWRHIAREDEFLKYQFLLSERYWWATPKTVAQVLEKVPKAKRAS